MFQTFPNSTQVKKVNPMSKNPTTIELNQLQEMPHIVGGPNTPMIPDGFIATWMMDDDNCCIIGITMWEVGCYNHGNHNLLIDGSCGDCGDALSVTVGMPIVSYMFLKSTRQTTINLKGMDYMLNDQMMNNHYMSKRSVHHV